MTSKLALRSLAAVCAAALALAVGCTTEKSRERTQQTENLLVAAGFKAISATTPLQQQEMHNLPPDRVSATSRNGKVYFVYPDRARQVLYVGNNNQYLAYEAQAQKPAEAAMVKQELESLSRSPQPASWSAPWGDWDSP
jgi:hypothetical protein